MKGKNGKQGKYKTKEELETKIEDYFNEKKKEKGSVPTVAGLAHFLGYCDRQSIYDLKKNTTFSCTIKRGLLQIEGYHESRLSGQGYGGSIFWLKNHGWKDDDGVVEGVNLPTIKIITEKDNNRPPYGGG